ncbi:MAG TPA: hypothetical protein VNR38_23360 [Ureibacillus sp.]|uniref:hypothetical protein n=1 Tax=Peribacillus asahii TaxID=228899 RepID=UPI00207A9C29|nr:hypothetical protein [Peribacillus asahii]USK58577.1 hypothetical protein LIT37_15210 [Peribacillus asahii]HWL26654.1 hypothetical protein [Ureibacillus sp.]
MKKVFLVLIASILFLSLTPTANDTAQAKAMWGKIELKEGMIGKVKIVKDTYQYSISKRKLKKGSKLKKGKEYGVYSYSKNYGGVYKIGSNKYVKKSSSIKYYKVPQSASLNFKKYNGNWFTSAKSQPGVGVNLEFTSNTKAKIDLYGIWWSMPDGSNARESDASGYNITFDKNGVGKVTFIESRAGNKGVATVKLSDNKVTLTVKYPSSYVENEFLDSYIYEGTHKLVPRKF